MDTALEDRFVVYLRSGNGDAAYPETVERPLASCSTYEEARRVREAAHFLRPADCVIRFVGPSGGGD
jgi:hypothetical protein